MLTTIPGTPDTNALGFLLDGFSFSATQLYLKNGTDYFIFVKYLIVKTPLAFILNEWGGWVLGWHQATLNLFLRRPLRWGFPSTSHLVLRLQCPMLSVMKDKPNSAFDLIGCRPAEGDLLWNENGNKGRTSSFTNINVDLLLLLLK